MVRKYLLPIFAILGAALALFVVFWSHKKQPLVPIPFPPARSPYDSAIYGAGIIEACTKNIAVGVPFIQPIKEIYVIEGARVKKGDPLFKLDTREFEAQKKTAESQLQAAVVNCENLKKQYSFYERLTDKRAVSEQAYEQAHFAMKEAKQQIAVATNSIAQIETNIQRATICAPVDGEILQVNAHVGEVFPTLSYGTTQSYTTLQTALILMGSVEPLQMRVNIDEEDSWRFIKGARATAFVRGNAGICFPMKFVRMEPYIIPKTSFTGQTIERIDTRVLQVLYRFKKKNLPVHAGQLLDVYIEAPPLPDVEEEPYP